MPVHVAKRGDEYCVVDEDGSPLKGGCHDSRADAVAQAQAVNISMSKENDRQMYEAAQQRLAGDAARKLVNAAKKVFGIELPKRDVVIYKDQGGSYRWVGKYSNCYRDNDHPPEIVSEKSQEGFVKLVDSGLVPKPDLWIWHSKSLKVGQSDWVAYDRSGFALAGGHFLPETDEIVEQIMKLDDVAMSHGMPKWSIERDEKDNSIITQHITEEISLLPGWAAANKRTGFAILDVSVEDDSEDIMAIPEEKRQELINWGISPDLIEALERQNSKESSDADRAGIERKEEETVVQVEDAVEEAASAEEVSEEETVAAEVEPAPVAMPDMGQFISVMEETVKAVVGIGDRLKELESIVKELKESDERKIANKAANTSLASLTELLNRSAIGNEEARIDGRTTLGKSGPAETQPEPEKRTGIPMIDGWLAGSNKSAQI